tara:strand:- start:397 stop:702 length:306 start_codon:yes stop_codon:yes gene_type:complete
MPFYKNTMRKFNSNRSVRKHIVTFFVERFSECAQANFLTKAKTFVTTIKYAPWLILGRMPTVKTDAVAYLPAGGFGEKFWGECSIKAPPESAFRKKLFILT